MSEFSNLDRDRDEPTYDTSTAYDTSRDDQEYDPQTGERKKKGRTQPFLSARTGRTVVFVRYSLE